MIKAFTQLLILSSSGQLLIKKFPWFKFFGWSFKLISCFILLKTGWRRYPKSLKLKTVHATNLSFNLIWFTTLPSGKFCVFSFVRFSFVCYLNLNFPSLHYNVSGKSGENAKFTEALDFVQEEYQCCGEWGWADYTTPNASNWHSTKLGVCVPKYK